MNDPDMGIWGYVYDANGNLTLQTDAKGQQIKFGYDALNRLTMKDYGADNSPEITFTYDEPTSTNSFGRLTTMADLSGTTKYFYDQLGRASKTVKTVDGVSYSTNYTYDGLDNVQTITYPDNEIVTNIYDNASDISSVTGKTYDGNGNQIQSTTYATYSGYNALGQPGNVTYGNGVTTNYTYFPTNNRLQSLTTTGPGATNLVNLSYSYYNNGNIQNLTDFVNPTTPHNSISRSYSLFTGKAHAFGAIGANFQYDANGNMTSDGSRTITYNYDNMPQTVNGTAVSFVYDGAGQRVKKVTPTYTITYIDKLYECTSGNPCGKYIFAGADRIALKNSSGTYYYHPDHQRSSTVVTDANGIKVEGDFYSPFGETSSNPISPFTGVKHKYTSQELDSETGLYNYNARLYSPELGRFVSADAIVADPANPQNLNRYSYVLNNPLNYIDPTGFSKMSAGLSAVSFAVNSAALVCPIFKVPGAIIAVASIGNAAYEHYYGDNPTSDSEFYQTVGFEGLNLLSLGATALVPKVAAAAKNIQTIQKINTVVKSSEDARETFTYVLDTYLAAKDTVETINEEREKGNKHDSKQSPIANNNFQNFFFNNNSSLSNNYNTSTTNNVPSNFNYNTSNVNNGLSNYFSLNSNRESSANYSVLANYFNFLNLITFYFNFDYYSSNNNLSLIFLGDSE